MQISRGDMPTEDMLDGVMILVGGIVLLTPGFITDTLGFFLLIPWTRALIKYWIKQKIEKMLAQGTIISSNSASTRRHQDYEDADYY